MKQLLIFILTLILSSCLTAKEASHKRIDEYSEKDTFSACEIILYESIFKDSYISYFSVKKEEDILKLNNIKNIDYYWLNSIFIYSGIDYLLSGLTIFNSDKIYVYLYDLSDKNNDNLSKTSIGHELLHIYFYTLFNDSRANHFNTKSKTWEGKYRVFLNAVNKEYNKHSFLCT